MAYSTRHFAEFIPSVSFTAKIGGAISTSIAGGVEGGGITYQDQFPSGDVVISTWSPSPSSPSTLFDKVDETVPSDAEYIYSTAT